MVAAAGGGEVSSDEGDEASFVEVVVEALRRRRVSLRRASKIHSAGPHTKGYSVPVGVEDVVVVNGGAEDEDARDGSSSLKIPSIAWWVDGT